MTMATATRGMKLGQNTQTNADVRTAQPSEIKSLLLTDGQWHDVTNVKKIQFAISEASSPTNPDKLYPHLECEENGRSVVYSFKQIVGYSAESGAGSQSAQSSNFGSTSSRSG